MTTRGSVENNDAGCSEMADRWTAMPSGERAVQLDPPPREAWRVIDVPFRGPNHGCP